MSKIDLSLSLSSSTRSFAGQNPEFDILTHDFFAVGADPAARKSSSQTRSAKNKKTKTAKKQAGDDHLRTLQRLLRISPNLEIAEGLAAKGLDSASQIAAMSPKRFAATAKGVFGGDTAAALDYHTKAGGIKTAALHLYHNVKDLVASPHFRSAPFNAVGADVTDYFTQIPSYTSLFGNMDFFETNPAQTIFSPSAYFFDIMRIVEEYITLPNTDPLRTIPAGYTLKERRPDLFDTDLTPANAFDELPYLEIVTKILAGLVTARPNTPDAYQMLALAPYPFNLPYNQPLTQTRAAFQALAAPLAQIYRDMDVDRVDTAAVQSMDVWREAAGLSVAQMALVTQPTPTQAATLLTDVTAAYGYDIPYTPPAFPGRGLIGQLTDTADVVGIGTSFTSQLAVGDTIVMQSVERNITAIASDTALTVDADWPTATAAPYVVAPNPGPPAPAFNGAGTLSVTPDTDEITGDGTKFSSEINIGDQIVAANETRTVIGVDGDTTLRVDSPWPFISAGLDYVVTPAIAAPVDPYVGQGGVMFAAGQTTVVGVGTNFTADYANLGDIQVGETTVAVTKVTSDTELTVSQAWDFEIGEVFQIKPQVRTATIADFLPLAGTGTVEFSKGSVTVDGDGTEFIQQFAIGDQINAGGIVRTVVGIASETELTLDADPGTEGLGLPFQILRAQGIDLVDVFLNRTDMTQTGLANLVTQGLSAAELQNGAANGFFINDTGETPQSLSIYISNDPINPTQRISGLTQKRLDRISRFVRLAKIIDWEYGDLQWVMTALGVTDITDDLIMTIGQIKTLCAAQGWSVMDVAAQIWPLRTDGKGDGQYPVDPFDVIFNSPALLEGQDPYAANSKVPFDPDRTPVQVWTIADAEGDNGLIRDRLRAALQVTDAHLNLLAGYVNCLVGQSGSATFDLDLINLSWLNRLSWQARTLSWTIPEYLNLLGMLYYPTAGSYFEPAQDAVPLTMQALQQQIQVFTWVSNGDLSVDELKYVLTGNGAPGYAPDYAASDIPGFLNTLSTTAQPSQLKSDDFGTLQISPEQSTALFEQLIADAVINASGIFLDLTPDYDGLAGYLPIAVASTGNTFGFVDTSFVMDGNGITSAQSLQVYAALKAATPAVLVPAGTGNDAVDKAFTAQTDLSFLAPIFPDAPDQQIDTVRDILLAAHSGVLGLLNLLPTKIAEQQSVLTQSLGGFLSQPQDRIGIMLSWAAGLNQLGDYLAAFLTPLDGAAPVPDGVAGTLQTLSAAGLVADAYKLTPDQLAFIISPDGMPHFNIASWGDLTLINLQSLSNYATLRDGVGDTEDQLIRYFKTPPDTAAKSTALALATGWDVDDIVTLNGYFWPVASETDANSIAGLCRLERVFELMRRLGVRASALLGIIQISHLELDDGSGTVTPAHWATYQNVAQSALNIVNSRFTGQALTDTNTKIQATLNGANRDALLGNVLWWTNTSNPEIASVSDLYRYLLIDIEMSPCFMTSVIAQAISTVQLYMQRARMMQEPGLLDIEIPKVWWSWISNYRIWEANRKIFLYPENYIQPSLRRGATPQFEELSNQLLQNDPTKANVVKPFEAYINELATLGALRPVGAYQADRVAQDTGEDLNTIFMVARSLTAPFEYYFRSLDDEIDWGPWQKIDLTINSEWVLPVYALGRLFVFWVEADVGKSNAIKDQKSNTETVEKSTIRYAFYNNSEWTPPQTLQADVIKGTYPTSYPVINADPIKSLLAEANSYWKFPSVISTGNGILGAGTLSISKGLGTVDGVNTQFTREVRAGDQIICFGETRTVGAVVSDTSLVVTKPWTNAATNAAFKLVQKSYPDRFRPFQGEGTVGVTQGLQLVSGTNTKFTQQVNYGDSIEINGEVHLVITIQDDENLLVDAQWDQSNNAADYTVLVGRPGNEQLMVCFSPPLQTDAGVDFGSKVQTPNPTKNNFITAQNVLNESVYNGIWLASQYAPDKLNIAGTVPLTDCGFIDQNLKLSRSKVLLADYQNAATQNPKPFRGELIRQNARVTAAPSTNLLWDNYWASNLPYQDNSSRPPVPGSVDLLFDVNKEASVLLNVGNKPGSFLFDNGDEAFLARPTSTTSINALSDDILVGQRPWLPDMLNSKIISTGAYTANPVALADTNFGFVRLNTSLMPQLQQRLFAGGIDNLLSLESQFLRELPFSRFFPPPGTQPASNVVPITSDTMDFDGAFGLYFWEIFFHSTYLIADRLAGNKKYEEALTWLSYIFNPTQEADAFDAADSPARFWRFRPFREMDQPSLQKILTDPRQIRRYNFDPFDPDAIASIRHVAYAKSVVMRFVDIVLDWADSLFSQYTRESITQATNLYLYAESLLGKRPQSRGKLPLPTPQSFSDLTANYPTGEIPQFLIDLENTPMVFPDNDNMRYASQPINDINAYFVVPENKDFMQYWDRVDDRLYKIRHCMNIDGQVVPLALYAPPIDPAMLVASAAGGGGIDLASLMDTPVPYYRFSFLVERAKDLCSQLGTLSSALLSALEKQDAEALSVLMNSQDAVLLNLTTSIKEQEIEDTVFAGQALQDNLASAQYRQTYYHNLIADGLSVREQTSLDAMLASVVFNTLGTVTKTAAAIGYAVPQLGSPFAMTYGGQQIGNALNAASGVFEIGAAISNFVSQQTNVLAGYDRRSADWEFQKSLAGYDVSQLEKQILSNDIRTEIARQNLVIHKEQIKQNTEKADFYKSKFTNEKLYQWMVGRISALQFQTYTLAYQFALMAQRAFQYQYSTNRNFISFEYWDSAHKGLTAAEGLMLSLNQMQKASVDLGRSLEIERTVSLMETNPLALLQLKETGSCQFEFPEAMFDYDFPGQYNRKIKTLSVTIPTVVGPYQNIKATLTQTGNSVVMKADQSGVDAVNYLLGGDGATAPPASVLRTNLRAFERIVLSRASDDSGMLTTNLDDPQFLPFEGTGAVSSWRLDMPKGTNRIDFNAISDVLIKLNYTAIDGGSVFRDKVTALKALSPYQAAAYQNCKSMYYNDWQAFFAAVTPQSTTQTLSIPLQNFVPPHVSGAKVNAFYIRLDSETPPSGSFMTVKLTNTVTATVDLSPRGDMVYRFSQQGQSDPKVDKILAQSIECCFDLAQTPASLKKDQGVGLSPEKLQNMEIVFFYSGNVEL